MIFSKEHVWLEVKDDIAEVGLSQFKKNKMGKVVFVDMPEEDDSIRKGDVLFSVEFAKSQSEFESPITGMVVECNEDILDEPDILNDNCEGNYILKLDNPEEIDELLSVEEYSEFCKH